MDRSTLLLLVGLCGACSDYGLAGKDDEKPADTDAAVDTDTPPPDTDTPPDTSIDCTGVTFDDWSWVASEPFSDEADPADKAGNPWYAVGFDSAAYAAVTLPHQDIPIGTDRVYRATFTLDEIPPDVSLNLQSDDGLQVYLNGEEVGAWGGSWQQEGCVNEQASCKEYEIVPPVRVTDQLVVGSNVIASRVTNPVVNAYFSIVPVCVED